MLANKKVYLKEISTAGLVQLIREAQGSLNFDEHILPICKTSVDGGWEQCTPDTLYMLLSLQEIYGKVSFIVSAKHTPAHVLSWCIVENVNTV